MSKNRQKMRMVLKKNKDLFDTLTLFSDMERFIQNLYKTFMTLPDLHFDQNLKQVVENADGDSNNGERNAGSRNKSTNMKPMAAEKLRR